LQPADAKQPFSRFHVNQLLTMKRCVKVRAHDYDQAMTGQPIRLAGAITRDGDWTSYVKTLEGMPRRVPSTVAEIIKRIEADGWYLVATKGSHR
jgi:hypothetical protein